MVYFRVVDPNRSVVEVENHVLATSQISQTTLRSVLGQKDLDDLLTDREEINEELQAIIDEQTDPWGVKVSVVEVKDVEIPQQMQRAMARQAADRLESPTALQLRLFQTMGEIAVNQNSTIILPVLIDLIRPFMQPTNGADGTHHATRREEEEAERLYEEAVGDISPETKIPAENQTPDEARSRTEPT